jgi:hypothetical protein
MAIEMLCSGVTLAATFMLAVELLLRVSLSASLALLWRSTIRCLSVRIMLGVDLKPRGHAGTAQVHHDLGVKPLSVRPQSTVHSPTRGLRQVEEGVALPEQLVVPYRSSTREERRRFRPLLSSHVRELGRRTLLFTLPSGTWRGAATRDANGRGASQASAVISD